MKICKKCDIEKELYEYHKSKSGKDGHKNTCKKCINSNQPNVRVRSIIIKWYKKIKAIKYLGGKCNMCSDTDVRHLIFHHRNPDEKDITIKELLSGTTWERLVKEINKCELLCHNCHNEYHFNMYKNINTNKHVFLQHKGIKCNNCSYDKCSASLHFHHIDKTNKSFKLSDKTKYSNYKTIFDIEQNVIDELNKCEILCANCHMELDVDNSAIEYVLNNYDSIIINKTKQVDRELIYDMYFNQKMSQADIRKKLNLPKSTVFNVVKELRDCKK
jgi:hypothetical protein